MRPLRRSRVALLAILVAVGFVIPGVVTLERVRRDTVGVLDSSLRGPRVLGPGFHPRLRRIERVVRCSPFPYGSTIRFLTPEGSTLQARVAASLWLTPDGAGRLLSTEDSGRSAAADLLKAGIDRAIGAVLTDAARTSRVPDLGPVMKDRIARALEAYGRPHTDLTIDYLDAEGTVYATRQAELKTALRREVRDTGVKILLVGLDGADWQIADPLIAAGRLPTLARLKAGGAWGSIRSLRPSLSPLLWTSVATGTTPDRHGITDFLVRDPDTGRLVPVTSHRRREPAFWDYFTWAGRTVDVVAWWATWPAERINGHMVSDRVSYSLFEFDLPPEGTGTTWPPEYFAAIRGRLVGRDQVAAADLAFFVEAGSTAGKKEGDNARFRDPVEHLATIVAGMRSYHAVALDLVARGQPDMLAVYYQAIDEVSHRFMHFVPPVLPGVDPEAVARFGRAVDRIYEYQDRLLGELLAAVDPSTVVIVVSDHGFVNGPDRPVGLTADIEGQPGRWHRQFGILAMTGGPIVRGPKPATSLLDLLPTALYLAGLPVPEDIRGRPLIDFIDPGFRERFPVRQVASYRSGSFTPDTGPVTATMAAVEETFVEKLRSLGYIGETGAPGGRSTADEATPGGGVQPAGPATAAGGVPAAGLPAADTVTAHANLAGVLLADGRLAEAEREILAAIAMVPDFRPARHQLVELRARQGRIGDAIAAAEGLLREGGGINPLFLNRVAELYLQAERGEAGMARFRTAVQAGHWIFGVALARLQIGIGDPAGAARTALAVLDQDPLNEPAMAVLFRALPAGQRAAGIEARLDRALKMNGRAVMFLNWKAILIEERGDRDRAEALLQSALATHPDHGGTVANLGAFYLRRDLPARATPLLRRAVTLEPANLEARVNLGTAMAMGGDLGGAIEAWEEAARRGVRTVDLFNALARAHHDRGDDAAAVGWLKQSLALDPAQEDVRQTLMQVDPGHGRPPR